MMDFSGKRVGIIGAGIENVALVPWLVKKGAKVVVADEHRQEELTSYQELQDLPVEFSLGRTYLDGLTDFDIVFRTPGAKRSTKEKLRAAAPKGVIVSSQTRLFFNLCPSPIIGVTGTKGKGTTASLIYEMLKAANFDVYLGGNIGVPPITFLEKLSPQSWVVLELSSFQLEDLEKSPHIAVVLGVTPDHLDIHSTFLDYIEAKKHIVRYQTEDDFAVLAADNLRTMEFAVETKAKLYSFSMKKRVDRGVYREGEWVVLATEQGKVRLVKLSETHLMGEHSLENIAAAAVAAHLAGAPIEAIRAGAKVFKGTPHALELVGEYRGVKYYDDSHATTPAPTIAAVRSFHESMTLIAGGSSKKSDFREFGRIIAKESTVKHVILLGNVEAPKIRAAIEHEMDKRQTVPDFYPVLSMDAAVETAVKLAKPGEVVLLSPAAASFDLFKNYKERGEKFAQAVKRYGA